MSLLIHIRGPKEEGIEMVRTSHIAPDDYNVEDGNKFCEVFACQNKATIQLDLPFGEHGSTLFFLCEKCVEIL